MEDPDLEKKQKASKRPSATGCEIWNIWPACLEQIVSNARLYIFSTFQQTGTKKCDWEQNKCSNLFWILC